MSQSFFFKTGGEIKKKREGKWKLKYILFTVIKKEKKKKKGGWFKKGKNFFGFVAFRVQEFLTVQLKMVAFFYGPRF